MNLRNARPIGTLLLLVGGTALLANAGFFGALPSFVWVMILFALGAAVWTRGDRGAPLHTRLLPFIAVAVLAAATSGPFADTAVTGFIAMAFALTFVRDNRKWWALIPAGVMAGVCLIVTLANLFPRWDTGPLFLLALAGTFTLLYLLPPERGGQRWALVPAVVLIVITVLANDPGGQTPGWLVPIVLVGTGVYMLMRTRTK